ncbi:hypothetical protein C8Q75DRAFT_377801 [Abortiporus biennis]|nr:hypothetical protein C8Q75DRAFT_377801 [Abortiporus biennis]
MDDNCTAYGQAYSYFGDVIQHARQHNQLIPVAKLPAEILAEIFDIYSSHCYESRKDSSFHSRRGEVAEWTIVSHVCHYWRDISLSSSHLWSNICIKGSHSLYYLKTCLERSRETLLSVYLEEVFSGDRGEPPLPVLFMIFADHLHRIRSLHVSTKSSFLKDTPSPWRHIHVAPSLKYLTLITNPSHPVSPRLKCMGLRELLLRNTETPSLTHLKILDQQHNWVKTSYPQTLVKLEIQYVDVNRIPWIYSMFSLPLTSNTLHLPKRRYLL